MNYAEDAREVMGESAGQLQQKNLAFCGCH